MPDTSPVSGDAGLRAADARLRELLAERDAEVAELSLQVAAMDAAATGITVNAGRRTALVWVCAHSAADLYAGETADRWRMAGRVNG